MFRQEIHKRCKQVVVAQAISSVSSQSHLAQPAPWAIKHHKAHHSGLFQNACLQSQIIISAQPFGTATPKKKKKKSSRKRFIIMFIPVFPLEWLTSCYQLPVCRPHNFCDMLAPGCLARCFPAHFTHASVVLYSSRLSRLTSGVQNISEYWKSHLEVREVILQAGISCAGEVWEEGKVIVDACLVGKHVQSDLSEC